MSDQVMKEVDLRRDKIFSLYKYLYENPELALKEHLSAQRITKMLEEEGFTVEREIGGMPTAFKARKKNGSGPKIAFLAEYDALPEMGHGCGHNAIAAMSVGAALALGGIMDQLHGEVMLIGTPAEELGIGKVELLKSGDFDDVDIAMMIHPAFASALALQMTELEGLEIVFHGKAAHAATNPEVGINALDAVVLFFNNINALRKQLKDDVKLCGIIKEAGTATNVVPERGVLQLEVRAKEHYYFQEVGRKVRKCAEAAALATGCTVDISHCVPTMESININKTLCGVFKEQMDHFNLEYYDYYETGGCSDVGNVSWTVPCIQIALKVVENFEQMHTKEFVAALAKPYAYDQTLVGAKILAMSGLKLFKDPELVKTAKSEIK